MLAVDWQERVSCWDQPPLQLPTAHLLLPDRLFAGYANAKVFKCDNEKCPRPTCYIAARLVQGGQLRLQPAGL